MNNKIKMSLPNGNFKNVIFEIDFSNFTEKKCNKSLLDYYIIYDNNNELIKKYGEDLFLKEVELYINKYIEDSLKNYIKELEENDN